MNAIAGESPEGERVRALRLEIGLHQHELAELAGMSRTDMNRLENRGAGLGTWKRRKQLAGALGLPLEDFGKYVDGEITLRRALAIRAERMVS
jgi:transcriptional regulator with XRE-family HTH domain